VAPGAKLTAPDPSRSPGCFNFCESARQGISNWTLAICSVSEVVSDHVAERAGAVEVQEGLLCFGDHCGVQPRFEVDEDNVPKRECEPARSIGS
jgi:hypothetical protein